MVPEEQIGILELEDNLADVEKPPEVSAGPYEAEIQDVQEGTSGKGNTYYAIKFVIPSDQLPADIAEHYEDGAVLYYNRIVKPEKGNRRALFNLRKFIEAIGLDSNTTTIDPNEWMGQKARIHVVMGKWQGEERAEIKSIEAAEAKAAPARGRGGKGKGK